MPSDLSLEISDDSGRDQKGCNQSQRRFAIGVVLAGLIIIIIILAVELGNAKSQLSSMNQGAVMAPVNTSAPSTSVPSAAPSAAPTTAPTGPPSKFRLVTYNDVYDSAPRTVSGDPNLLQGGAAYVAGYVQAVRHAEPNTLVLMAGDTISPSLLSQFLNGSQMIQAHNAIGLNYACLGNHEFDMGVSILKQRINESNFVWLNSNVYEPDNTTLITGTINHTIVDYGFVKIGLFGTLYQVPFLVPSVAVVRDPLVAASAQIAALKAKGATFIIAIAHVDYVDACKIAALPGVNLVVAGHDHVMQSGSCTVPVVVATSDWANVWDITADYGRPGGTVANSSNPKQAGLITLSSVPITNELVSPVQALVSLVQNEQLLLKNLTSLVLGMSSIPMDLTTSTTRTKECPYCDFVLDYLRLQWQTRAGLPSVSLLNGGGFRSNQVFPAGNISIATVLTIHPFANVMPVFWLTGLELRNGLEEAFTRSEFPQVSGIYYVVDVTKPAGSRVSNVTWAPNQANFTANATVADSDYFLVTTNDFFYNLFSSWALARTNSSRVVTAVDEAVLLSALVQQAVQLNSPIAPAADGRIISLI